MEASWSEVSGSVAASVTARTDCTEKAHTHLLYDVTVSPNLLVLAVLHNCCSHSPPCHRAPLRAVSLNRYCLLLQGCLRDVQ